MSNHPLNCLGQPYDTFDLTSDLKRVAMMLRETANELDCHAAHECPAGMFSDNGARIALRLREYITTLDLAYWGAKALEPAEFAALMAGSRRAA